MSLADDPRANLRRIVYGLLIAATAATLAARVFHVESASGRTPFLSANDRSRWCTVRALVDHGTFVIDDVLFTPDGKRDRDWYSIDIVRHKGHDGHEHFYSSKPPLFATLLAGEYWLIKNVTGATLADHPFFIARIMLLFTNVLPLVAGLWLLARWVEQTGETDFGRVFTVAAACGGTYLTTMAVTINNHTPAALSALVAMYATQRIWRDEHREWHWFALAGFFAAFATANELPALALFACLATGLFWKDARRTAIIFTPSAAVVAVAIFGTNYLAHGSWLPAYAARHDGKIVVAIDQSTPVEQELGAVPDVVRRRLDAAQIKLSDSARIQIRPRGTDFMLWDPTTETRLAIVAVGNRLEIREWANWYEYEGSYWLPDKKAGVDRGEPSRVVYAFHTLAGHHGIFSLTPIWLLTIVGLRRWLTRAELRMRGFAFAVTSVSFVCLVFYLLRPPEDLNYGGVSCGFRWMFWFIPLWLLALVPAADACSTSRLARGFAVALLLVSIFSSAYSATNPWSHPWLFQYWSHLGWINY